MGGASILVVDDDRDTCASVSDILSNLGYRVDVAHDGQNALKTFEKGRHRRALLDYKMPGMDGLELCQHLKGAQPDVHVVLVTGFSSEATTDAAAKVGVRRVMAKPVDFEELIPLVEAVVGATAGE
jgi:two-component system response regulator AtoC